MNPVHHPSEFGSLISRKNLRKKNDANSHGSYVTDQEFPALEPRET